MPFDGTPPQWKANLQPKQLYCYRSPATEILYGGAAFGGKSHLMRQAAISWCIEIPGLQAYIFRRVEDDLVKNHVEGPTGFRNMLADKPWAKVLQGEIRFTNGSRIFLCHCKDEEHKYKYHGSEIHVLMIDELTTFTESIYRYLRFRVRMVNIDLPAHYREGHVMPDGSVLQQNVFPRILCGSNPGNVGHHWVKRTFIDVPHATEPRRTKQIEGGMIRQYIPARLTDNPRGVEADPTYVNRMRGLGDPALVKAMELGDWNILAGGFFPEFSLEHHVLKAKTLPDNIFTKRFAAVDWGSAKPFSVGWYAIAADDWVAEGMLGNRIVVPRGSLVRYREWYGSKPDQNNVGLKLNVQAWAKGVMERTPADEKLEYVVCDTQMWAEDGGPSLAERAMKVKHHGRTLPMRKADKRREPGWDQLRQRLREDPDDPSSASLFLMDNQPDGIRVIQAVQHDELKVEDIDTDQEDHPIDEVRYACMSRPKARAIPTKRKVKGPKQWTMDWLDKMDSEERERLARQRTFVH